MEVVNLKLIINEMKLNEELEFYSMEQEKKNRSSKTITNYKIIIGCLLDYIKNNYKDFKADIIKVDGEIIHILEIKVIVNQYIKYLALKKKNKNNSINLKIIVINNFFKFLDLREINRRGNENIIKIDLLKADVKFSIDDHRILGVSDFYRLLEVTKEEGDSRATALFKFLLDTGARISEALSINIENIEKISVLNFRVKIIGKGGKPRNLDFDREVYNSIINYLRDTGRTSKTQGALFVNRRTDKRTGQYERCTPLTADRIIKKYGKRTGLEITKFFSHNIRHLSAKSLLDGGATLDKVKNFLGHTNIATTSIYTMGTNSELTNFKATAKNLAKENYLLGKYGAEYHDIIKMLAKDKTLSDREMADRFKVSKATYSRKYGVVTKKIRTEYEV